MIETISPAGQLTVSAQTAKAFEAMLPSIQRVASYRFRRVPRWRREELIADVVAKAYLAYVELVARGKAALAYPTVLATYAVRQVRDGRQVGCRQNVHEVLSGYAQSKRGFSIQPLQQPDVRGDWEELLEDRKGNPAEIAACRVDFGDWLRRLKRFKRQVALRLAGGDTTSDAALHFCLSPARISQLRQELRADWEAFQAVPSAA